MKNIIYLSTLCLASIPTLAIGQYTIDDDIKAEVAGASFAFAPTGPPGGTIEEVPNVPPTATNGGTISTTIFPPNGEAIKTATTQRSLTNNNLPTGSVVAKASGYANAKIKVNAMQLPSVYSYAKSYGRCFAAGCEAEARHASRTSGGLNSPGGLKDITLSVKGDSTNADFINDATEANAQVTSADPAIAAAFARAEWDAGAGVWLVNINGAFSSKAPGIDWEVTSSTTIFLAPVGNSMESFADFWVATGNHAIEGNHFTFGDVRARIAFEN